MYLLLYEYLNNFKSQFKRGDRKKFKLAFFLNKICIYWLQK
jgi:hypothetical protein